MLRIADFLCCQMVILQSLPINIKAITIAALNKNLHTLIK